MPFQLGCDAAAQASCAGADTLACGSKATVSSPSAPYLHFCIVSLSFLSFTFVK
jgi:hypothetical protein